MYFPANTMGNNVTKLAYLLDIFLHSYFCEVCVLTYIVYNELSDYEILTREWLGVQCTK